MSIAPYQIFMFVLSLLVCGLCVKLFLRALLDRLPKNILTIPSQFFIWIYFIIVPMVNVAFDTYVDEYVFITEPIEALTILNFFNSGLLIIAAIGAKFIRSKATPDESKEISPFPTGIFTALALMIIFSLFYGIYVIYITGSVLDDSSGQLEFRGSLYQYIIIESIPLNFCWLISLYFIAKRRRPEIIEIAFIGIIQLALILAFSTSRGSRVAIISQLLICAQIYNFSVYRFKLAQYVVGGIALVMFLQVYAYYKYGGINALNDYLSGRNSSATVDKYNNPVTFLVGDIGRADIQAPLITRYAYGRFEPNNFGETYLSGLSLLLPKSLRPDSLRPKIQVGADAQLDPGGSSILYRGVVLDEGNFVSSRIYGLFGEALLNFGWIGPPIAFLLFGILARVALLRAVHFHTWQRMVTAPFFAAIPIYLLFYDFDNLIVQTVTVWTVPIAILVMAGFLAKHGRAR